MTDAGEGASPQRSVAAAAQHGITGLETPSWFRTLGVGAWLVGLCRWRRRIGCEQACSALDRIWRVARRLSLVRMPRCPRGTAEPVCQAHIPWRAWAGGGGEHGQDLLVGGAGHGHVGRCCRLEFAGQPLQDYTCFLPEERNLFTVPIDR